MNVYYVENVLAQLWSVSSLVIMFSKDICYRCVCRVEGLKFNLFRETLFLCFLFNVALERLHCYCFSFTQVELHTNLEAKLPLKLLEMVDKPEYTYYPNKCSGQLSKVGFISFHSVLDCLKCGFYPWPGHTKDFKNDGMVVKRAQEGWVSITTY